MSLKAIINSLFSSGSGTAIADNVLVRGDGTAGGIQGSGTTLSDGGGITLATTGYISKSNAFLAMEKADIAEDATRNYSSFAGTTGIARINIEDLEEYAIFGWTSAGVVTLIANSTNVSTTKDNAGTFNIFDNGSNFALQNKLTGTKTCAIFLEYNAP